MDIITKLGDTISTRTGNNVKCSGIPEGHPLYHMRNGSDWESNPGSQM
jgi:hypothetical protein